MLKVTCTVPFEKTAPKEDEKMTLTSVPATEVTIVDYGRFVDIEVGDMYFRVDGQDLIDAVRKCMLNEHRRSF